MKIATKRPKVLFLLNQLRAGTGPFQRAIRLDDHAFDIEILSCYDSTEQVRKTARMLRTDFGRRVINGLGEINKVRLAFALLKYIKNSKPDIIQTAHTYSTLMAILISRVFGLGLVVNFEGTLFSSLSPLRRFLLNFFLSFANGSICVSNAVKNTNSFSENILRHHMVRRVIYNGVDHKDIDVVANSTFGWQDRINENSFVIGFVGDLKPVKDISTLIDAFVFVAAKCPRALLLLVGGGPLENSFRKQVERAGIVDRVIFTRHIERSEVYGALNLMDVFVMPSLIEGLCESIAQAMAKSLPIIASDIEPNRELIQNGVNGYLFPVGDSKLLFHAIMSLYSDADKRKEFSQLNRKISEERLDIYQVVKQYELFYRELLDKRWSSNED